MACMLWPYQPGAPSCKAVSTARCGGACAACRNPLLYALKGGAPADMVALLMALVFCPIITMRRQWRESVYELHEGRSLLGWAINARNAELVAKARRHAMPC